MFRILKKSLKTGIVTGQHPEAGEHPTTSHRRFVKGSAVQTVFDDSRSGYRFLQRL